AGLDEDILKQFVEDGVESSGEIAKALAEGGAAAVAEANRLQEELEKLANQSGKTWSKEFYDAGVEIAEGIVSALEKSEKKLKKTFKKLAKLMVDTMKEELGIASPSTVFEHEVGDDGIIAGLTQSLERAVGVEAAAAKLAAKAVPAPPAMGGFGGRGGLGGFGGAGVAAAAQAGANIHIEINLQGSATQQDATLVGAEVRRQLENLGTVSITRGRR